MDELNPSEVQLYIENAHESLAAAQLNLDHDFYTAAINRAYYTIFYAANAILSTKSLSRSKHSGVISLFREHFIKSGILSSHLSEIYGRVMDDRHEGDYELVSSLSKEDAHSDINQAREFID